MQSQQTKKPSSHGKKNNGGGSEKLRGLPKDSPAVRLSKTLSWLLRHGAQSQGLPMRPDGYVKVSDLLQNPKIKSQSLDLAGLQEIVNADSKKRYDLVCLDDGEWFIKANQGHSIKTVKLDLKLILTINDIPSQTAVHGTTKKAWLSISSQGLSKMNRNHIHLAQGVSGENVISGMRQSCSILIFIDMPKALSSGVKFYLSDNGVVLTEGNEKGFLEPRFFEEVVEVNGKGVREVVRGWGKGERVSDNPSGSIASGPAESGLPTNTSASDHLVTATSTLVPGSPSLEEKLGDVEIRD